MNYFSSTYISDIGLIEIFASMNGITHLLFKDKSQLVHFDYIKGNENIFTNMIKHELDLYFSKKLNKFSTPIDIKGTPFQKKVWNSLLKIPYGQTRTYQDIAINIGNKNACRAVGLANKKNPLAIIVPCHRVIGKTGDLIGYDGGVDIKKYLLELEGILI